jgi:hypothetical protein
VAGEGSVWRCGKWEFFQWHCLAVWLVSGVIWWCEVTWNGLSLMFLVEFGLFQVVRSFGGSLIVNAGE